MSVEYINCLKIRKQSAISIATNYCTYGNGSIAIHNGF